jgi:hypothetical protein
MSIEYFGKPGPPLSDALAACAMTRIKSMPGLIVVRDEGHSVGLDFEGLDREERIDVNLREDRVYIGFYVATGRQREEVVNGVKDALEACGVHCDLEED